MRHLIARALLSVVVALAAGAAGAVAATTSGSVLYGEKGGPRGQLSYSAGPGEVNGLTLTYGGGEGWVFTDTGATIEPGRTCKGGGQRVSCDIGGTTRDSISLWLADRGDELTIPPNRLAHAFVSAQGGSGADTLRAPAGEDTPHVYLMGDEGDDLLESGRGGVLEGGTGADRLSGGAEMDDLRGGPGPDELRAGNGDDLLNPGPDGDPDLVDGGPGRDHLSYDGTREPLTIDMGRLRAAPGDVLRSIESVSGGQGRDTLLGGAGADRLSGGGAGDVIDGRAGDDVLHGISGRDRIIGGPGDDSLEGWNGDDVLQGGPGDDFLAPWTFEDEDRRERIACGSGEDTVRLADNYRGVVAAMRPIPADCELLDVENGGIARVRARPRFGGGVASWSVRCVYATSNCPVSVSLFARDALIGEGRLTLRPGRRGTLRVPLDATGRSFARSGGRLEVNLMVRSPGGGFGLGHTRDWLVTVGGR